MAKLKNKTVQDIDPENLDTYFKRRMYALGITSTKQYGFRVESLEYPGSYSFYPIFAEAKNGNIQINYPALHGGAEMIADSEQEFFRQRIHPDNQTDQERKYFQEPKSGVHIFHTPGIIEKFKKKETITTLFVVEGEFKAFAGYLAGLDIVGLGGKDLFKDKDGDLHEDLQLILRDCRVENLVLLLDADVLHLNWNPEENPYKDLAKRQFSFYNTVVNFRELAKGKVKDAYFSHIKPSFCKVAKGLDDLLEVKADEKAAIIEDLFKLRASSVFFDCRNVKNEPAAKLKDYFLLKYSKDVPLNFYERFEDIIQDNEFTFNGARYQKEKDKDLKLVKHQDSFKFVRVACDYFKIIKVPNSKGILELRRVPWKKGEITMDYVQKGHANFYDTIDKYDAFCNVPDNTSSYQQVINDCYNLYYKLEHEPAEGSWDNIKQYLLHVFGEANLPAIKKRDGTVISDGTTTNFDLALDCLQLKYLQPTQKLPILCLVNKERNTGKSTFLWLMREIFNENATVIGTQELNDQYNDDWASKAIIGIDEGFIDKRTVLERVKSQSTNDKIKLRGMYAGRQDVSFFGWFILTSNDEENFLVIDKEEVRFWVNKVPVYKQEDPNLLKKMVEEIPAFLHYLKHRQIVHPQTSRFWFAKELLETDALRKIKENSKGWFAAELKEILIDKFDYYKYHTLYYTLTEIFNMLNGDNSAVRFRKGDIKKQLEDKFGLKSKNNRWQQPVDPHETNALGPRTEEKHGRCYEFRIEDFLREDQIKDEFGDYFSYEEIIAQRATTSTQKDDLPF